MAEHSIDRVETIIVDLPLIRTQRFAALNAATTAILLIRIGTDSGIEAIGECTTPSGPWWGGESIETIKVVIDTYLAPLLIGRDPFDIVGLQARSRNAVFGNWFAKAGIEMALLDLQGKITGQPVAKLLGGIQRRSMPCSWPLATGNADLEIEEAESLIDRHIFNIFKLKMGFLDPVVDVARAVRIATALGDRAKVRVDPNERWTEATCRWAVPRMADAGIEFIEQPLARDDLEGSSRVRSMSPAAVILDESVWSIQDALRAGRAGAGDAVSIKPMKHGGLLAARRLADVCAAVGLSTYVGTFLEASVGTNAVLQLSATFGNLPYDGEIAGAHLVAEDLTTEPVRYENFEIHLPDGVGIACQIDEDKVAAMRRDRSHTPVSLAAV